MIDNKKVFRLTFETEIAKFSCLVSHDVSHAVLGLIGKERIVRFTDIRGNRHAVIVNRTFHIQSSAWPRAQNR